MTLQLSLQIIFVIVDDSLIGNWDEYLFSFFVGEIMNSIVDVIVETDSPLQLEGAGFTKILFFEIVLAHVSYTI